MMVIPFFRVKIISHQSIHTVLNLLKENTAPSNTLSKKFGYNFSKKPWIGRINKNSFKITMGGKSVFQRLFPPTVFGRIKTRNNESTIIITIIPRPIDIFFYLITIFLLVMTLTFKDGIWFGLIPLGIYVMLIVSYNYFTVKSKKLIKECLKLNDL